MIFLRCISDLVRWKDTEFLLTYFASGLQPIKPKSKTASDQYLTLNKAGWVHCSVAADPRAKFFWSKANPWPFGERLDEFEFVPFSNGSLFVRKAKKSYEGDYYCTAVNSGGYESTDISVKVGGKNMEIESFPGRKLVCLGIPFTRN